MEVAKSNPDKWSCWFACGLDSSLPALLLHSRLVSAVSAYLLRSFTRLFNAVRLVTAPSPKSGGRRRRWWGVGGGGGGYFWGSRCTPWLGLARNGLVLWALCDWEGNKRTAVCSALGSLLIIWGGEKRAGDAPLLFFPTPPSSSLLPSLPRSFPLEVSLLPSSSGFLKLSPTFSITKALLSILLIHKTFFSPHVYISYNILPSLIFHFAPFPDPKPLPLPIIAAILTIFSGIIFLLTKSKKKYLKTQTEQSKVYGKSSKQLKRYG